MAYTGGWADLPLDLLGEVIPLLPLPADRARFAAVCRAWRSAARQLASHLPWLVLPNGTFGTAGHRAGYLFRLPGLPDNTTCLGAAHDGWLALDCTDDVVRRTLFRDRVCKESPMFKFAVYARAEVSHKHTYLLHNPFSNTTVPLPELDAVIGHVAETFLVRKVLMRSPATDDIIAITTNSWDYNIILCRPGKGTFVLDWYRVVDIAFLGDILYGITSGEELLAFHLGEDVDGKPTVTRIELIIKNPLAKYNNKSLHFWSEEIVGYSDSDDDDDDDGEMSSSDEKEDLEENQEDQEEEESNQAEENQDEEDDGNQEASLGGDGMVSDNEMRDGYDMEVPYEPKDEIYLSRYLVNSRKGELLLVRHRYQVPPYSNTSYTRKVEVLRADFSDQSKCCWVAASPSDGLVKGEAIFLGPSYSKCTRACGDIKDGFIYYTSELKDIFDTTSCTTQRNTFGWPWQCGVEHHYLITWLFPPELVV